MREIKFRVWDRIKEKMYDPKGYIILDPSITQYIYLQFTGLNDIQETPLYIGDIIETPVGELFLIVDSDTGWDCQRLNKGREGLYLSSIIKGIRFIIIGNKYENKELLK